jgi:hypothetical protein
MTTNGLKRYRTEIKLLKQEIESMEKIAPFTSNTSKRVQTYLQTKIIYFLMMRYYTLMLSF